MPSFDATPLLLVGKCQYLFFLAPLVITLAPIFCFPSVEKNASELEKHTETSCWFSPPKKKSHKKHVLHYRLVVKALQTSPSKIVLCWKTNEFLVGSCQLKTSMKIKEPPFFLQQPVASIASEGLVDLVGGREADTWSSVIDIIYCGCIINSAAREKSSTCYIIKMNIKPKMPFVRNCYKAWKTSVFNTNSTFMVILLNSVQYIRVCSYGIQHERFAKTVQNWSLV